VRSELPLAFICCTHEGYKADSNFNIKDNHPLATPDKHPVCPKDAHAVVDEVEYIVVNNIFTETRKISSGKRVLHKPPSRGPSCVAYSTGARY
jgi:hypothetical protein